MEGATVPLAAVPVAGVMADAAAGTVTGARVQAGGAMAVSVAMVMNKEGLPPTVGSREDMVGEVAGTVVGTEATTTLLRAEGGAAATSGGTFTEGEGAGVGTGVGDEAGAGVGMGEKAHGVGGEGGMGVAEEVIKVRKISWSLSAKRVEARYCRRLPLALGASWHAIDGAAIRPAEP